MVLCDVLSRIGLRGDEALPERIEQIILIAFFNRREYQDEIKPLRLAK